LGPFVSYAETEFLRIRPTNIILCRKGLPRKNSLAYYYPYGRKKFYNIGPWPFFNASGAFHFRETLDLGSGFEWAAAEPLESKQSRSFCPVEKELVGYLGFLGGPLGIRAFEI
jgi:hypothetical protein